MLPAPPLPNAAPISAPLPVCSSTTRIKKTHATKWMMVMTVINELSYD